MNPDMDIHWNDLPPKMIQLIATYSHLVCQLNLRQLNKRTKSIMDPIVFNQLPSEIYRYNSDIIQKYGNYFNRAYMNLIEESHFDLIMDYCKNISELTILIEEENFTKFNIILNQYQGSLENLEIRTICSDYCPHDFSDFNEIIGKMKLLKTLSISYDSLFCRSIPVFDRWNNITKLKLKTVYSMAYKLLNSIEKLTNLTDLTWTITDCRFGLNKSQLNLMISPSSILDRVKLKRLDFLLHDNKTSIGCPKKYFANQFQQLMSHTRFIELESLRFYLVGIYFMKDAIIFDRPLPNLNQHCPQLTYLKLAKIDPHLITYIIQHFPNLQKLDTNSPLVLPEFDDSLKLPPMINLRYLTCRNMENKARNRPHIIHHLFPNVTNLFFWKQYFEERYSSPYQGISDTDGIANQSEPRSNRKPSYFISQAFPNLKFMAFDRDKEIIQQLINQPDLELRWEELYIKWCADDDDIVAKLISKLPYLKYIYVDYFYNLSFDKKFQPEHIKIFQVKEFDPSTFKLELHRQLQ